MAERTTRHSRPTPEPSAIKRVLARWLGRLLALVLRVWSATWRKDVGGLERLDRLLEDGDRIVAVFWHGSYFPLFALAAGRPAIIFTSRSFRGHVIAELSRRFGYRASIVPQDRTGLEHIEKTLAIGARLAAIALDGPRGPLHAVKPGAIRAASALGLRIVPVGIVSRPKFTVAGRWDRREVPLPFAKVAIRVGEPLDVPPGLGATELGRWQALLGERMQEVAA